MHDRREFLKQTAAGALLLSAEGPSVFAGKAAKASEPGKSRVVVARDPQAHDDFHELMADRVDALLDRAMAAYTGLRHPGEAWRHVLGKARVVGLKTNGLGGKGISTHALLVFAIAARLEQAGIEPGNIIVWDRNARDLQACGLTISTDATRMRCFGSDVSGYEDQDESWGSAHVHLSRILSECDMVIGVPILKDHSMAGITFAMKNMYGVIQRPQDLHGGGCCPGVADLNCVPTIRAKVRFTIGDALASVYDGGPGFHPERLWYSNTLIVGEDRVAVDQIAWQMIERKRAEAGLASLTAAGRPPRYIAVAADAEHALGTNDPSKMEVLEI